MTPNVGTAEPELETHPHPSLGVAGGDWLCAWCHNRVASDRDRFKYEGRSEFTFRNVEGTRFNILTFSRTLGCEPAGVPTLEYTWFPSHAWSFCMCDQCKAQIGWFYTGPEEFAGLVRERIVQASLVAN